MTRTCLKTWVGRHQGLQVRRLEDVGRPHPPIKVSGWEQMPCSCLKSTLYSLLAINGLPIVIRPGAGAEKQTYGSQAPKMDDGDGVIWAGMRCIGCTSREDDDVQVRGRGRRR